MTLTLGIAYLTVLSHERNRTSQAGHLRAQTRVLNSIVSPIPEPPLQSRAELAREERSNLTETAKDRWNDEVEGAVRWLQHADWEGVRNGMEGAIARLLGGGLQRSREGIEEAEKKGGPLVQDALDRSRAAASRGAEQAAVAAKHNADRAAHSAKDAAIAAKHEAERLAALTRDAAVAAKENVTRGLIAAEHDVIETTASAKAASRDAWGKTVEKSHETADKVQYEAHKTAGTVDAARVAVKDAISKGVEKGKELVGSAQAATESALNRAEAKGAEAKAKFGPKSEVEKALQQRYESPRGLDRSVLQALEERYRPIGLRDNTVLRGV